MFRLLYNKEILLFNSNNIGKFYPMDSKREVNNKTFIDAHEKILKQRVIKNYKKFLEIIKNEKAKENEANFFCFLDSNRLIMAIQHLDSEIKHFCTYEIENSEIQELIEKIFNFKDFEGRALSMNVSNKYTLLMPFPILKLFFVSADMKAAKKDLYRCFKIPKKNKKKMRQIVAPSDEIKPMLKEINTILQSTYDSRNISFQVAYKKGKNIKNNAEIHTEKKFLMTADLKDFFPSCKRPLVKKYVEFLFRNSPNSDIICNHFLDLVLWDDSLFIGNPISGTLANVILSPAMNYIKNIANKFDVNFSIYADDMTFSSDKFISEEFVKNIFNLALSTYDLGDYFKLNEEKFKGYSGTRRHTVGLSINPKNEITIPNKVYRNMRARVHQLHYQIKLKGGNLNQLRGLFAFTTAYDDSGKIYRLIKKYEETIKKYKLCSDKVLERLEEKFNA